MTQKFTLWFEHIDEADKHIVGDLGLTLGRLTQNYLPIPKGFVITADAFSHFLSHNKLEGKIESILTNLNTTDPEDLQRKSNEIKKLITSHPFPEELKKSLLLDYSELTAKVDWSKGTVEKILRAFESKGLPVLVHGEVLESKRAEGEANLADAVRSLWAEHYSPQELKKTRRPKGHLIVQSTTSPDTRVTMFKTGKDKIHLLKDLDRYEIDQKNPSLIDAQILKGNKLPREVINKLTSLFLELERVNYFPSVVEFGISSGEPHILYIKPQSFEPEIVESFGEDQKSQNTLFDTLTLSGEPTSPGRKTAPGKIVRNYHEASKKILPGDILITDETTNHFLPVLIKVSGIITTKGTRHSHASAFAKKRGIPSVLLDNDLIANFKDGKVITIDGQIGEVKI